MLDLITIGNISADLYFSADEFTTKGNRLYLSEGKYFSNEFHFMLGGGAANVAIGAKKNGLKTSVCSVIGNNVFRKHILHTLKLKGIPTNLASFKQNYTNVSTILLKKSGERTIINYESPHEHIGEEKELNRKLRQTRAIYFGNLPDVSLSERIKLLTSLKKKKIFIYANIGSRDCCRPKSHVNELLEQVDVLIVNGYEFSELVKKPYVELNFSKNMIKLLPIMKDKILIVTDSKKGSYGYQAGEVYFQKAIEPTKITDTTGAGDGYTAGFIASYFREEDIQKAMNKGARYASRILARLGAN